MVVLVPLPSLTLALGNLLPLNWRYQDILSPRRWGLVWKGGDSASPTFTASTTSPGTVRAHQS